MTIDDRNQLDCCAVRQRIVCLLADNNNLKVKWEKKLHQRRDGYRCSRSLAVMYETAMHH